MALLSILGFNRIPPSARAATLVIAAPETLPTAYDFLAALRQKFGPVVLAGFASNQHASEFTYVQLPRSDSSLRRALQRLAPQRLIVLGETQHVSTLQAIECPRFWINAPRKEETDPQLWNLIAVTDPSMLVDMPHALLTGDPLLELPSLPQLTADNEICARFRDHREAGRWIGYFAATGMGEETIAYATFFALTRRKMGLLVLAPHDPARYEPVYRDAIKYHLPTNRHNRLSTSFVPIKSRVYYIEDPDTLKSMYACADFVVVGGTLCPESTAEPDVVTPTLLGVPTLVGPVRNSGVVRAAVRAGAVAAADNDSALVDLAFELLTDPARCEQQIARARAWVRAQFGARERVLDLLE